jgi:hypothetical protein
MLGLGPAIALSLTPSSRARFFKPETVLLPDLKRVIDFAVKCPFLRLARNRRETAAKPPLMIVTAACVDCFRPGCR